MCTTQVPHSLIHSLFIHSTHILLCSFHELDAIPGPGVTAGNKTGETLFPMELSLLVETNTKPIATYMWWEGNWSKWEWSAYMGWNS